MPPDPSSIADKTACLQFPKDDLQNNGNLGRINVPLLENMGEGQLGALLGKTLLHHVIGYWMFVNAHCF